jgi:glycerol uptake facilitator-like aquaporin
MTTLSYSRRLTAEALGTALLLAVVVGSGIMGQTLAGGNTAVALMGNTMATGAALVVLITVFGPLSGAHFNPIVTAVFAWRREIGLREAMGYIAAQFAGAIAGVWIAHLMFGQAVWQVSTRLRDGPALAFSEGVATFGLILTILGTLRFKPAFTPSAVGLYIISAYWFTASTSFANPAVTVARALSNTFAGIAPHSVPLFIAAQCTGALGGAVVCGWLFSSPARELPHDTGHLS